MNTFKKLPFYIDKYGTYGSVTVKAFKGEKKGKSVFKTEIQNEGRSIMYISQMNNHIVLRSENMKDEEFELLNDALIQLDLFRGLVFIKRHDKWCLIVEGESVEFNKALEIYNYNGSTFVAVPYGAIKEKEETWA